MLLYDSAANSVCLFEVPGLVVQCVGQGYISNAVRMTGHKASDEKARDAREGSKGSECRSPYSNSESRELY